MAALEARCKTILKNKPAECFVPFLLPLLGNINSADHAAKQLFGAFRAFSFASCSTLRRRWGPRNPLAARRQSAVPEAGRER
ncbi:MAG: hypothetical protein JSR64_22615 [Nitrospira sp.]|uniref:hypothetical protein n=1 Tax=Plasticicumulans sp. TaxID=2307179 RepID=UPI001D9FFECE|nr:hypothetical protein [Nitrospira sp.]HNI00682.1 hypothetical protein [Rhodocyclaceae bacterium]